MNDFWVRETAILKCSIIPCPFVVPKLLPKCYFPPPWLKINCLPHLFCILSFTSTKKKKKGKKDPVWYVLIINWISQIFKLSWLLFYWKSVQNVIFTYHSAAACSMPSEIILEPDRRVPRPILHDQTWKIKLGIRKIET